MQTANLTVERFFTDNEQSLKLGWVSGLNGGQLEFAAEGTAPADLVGHLNLIHPTRAQVLGHQEIFYFEKLDPERRVGLTEELIAGNPPALIVAEGFVPPDELLEMCNRRQVPLFTSPLDAGAVIDMLRHYLSKTLAEKVLMHGVFLDVLGVGVLISGESGLGKSELGLELISRGSGLVADDAVEFSRIAPDAIEGRCPPLLQNLLEVRGLGLLDIKAIFGETAVRRKMRLRLICHLIRKAAMEQENFERLPIDHHSQEILGLQVHKVVLPVAAGRNLAVLIEAAVRNYVLHLRGIDTMRQFQQRQRALMMADSNNDSD